MNRELHYDAHNDLFVRPLLCPHPGCGAPSPYLPDEHDALAFCTVCERPFEVVRVQVGEASGTFAIHAARRARTLHCTTTGERITKTSLLDWAGAGGGPSRTGAIPDRRGQLFGEPTRDIEWDLVAGWSQPKWGVNDAARIDEMVTSVSVFRGVVVAVSAQGTVGLFSAEDGRPLLDHPLSWPGIDLDDDDHARAVRLPPAFMGSTMIMSTDRVALFRDLAPSLFPASRRSTPGLFVDVKPAPGKQFVGPALACGGDTVLLVEATVSNTMADAVVRVFDLVGTEKARHDAPGIVRPPAWDPLSRRALWVNTLGHVTSLEIGKTPTTSLPSEMLTLSPGERPHLCVAPDVAGTSELWLADDTRGSVRVWRTPLSAAIRQDVDWSWENLLAHADTGALRGFAVGFGSRDRKNVSSQYLVVSTERATSALSRAVKGAATDVVLSRAPIAPPIVTSVGFLSQDKSGLWLRALAPWAFKDKNPERYVAPPAVEGRPAFYDRTIAVLGRQVFWAHGGRICEARLIPRRRAEEQH